MRKERRKMKKISPKLIRVCNIACAVLMLALLVLQFLPFWTFPACTCTKPCGIAKFQINQSCEMCRAYREACAQIPPSPLTKHLKRLDYSKEWQISIQQYTWTPEFSTCNGATEWFEKYFQDLYEYDDFEFLVKDIVLMPVLVLFGTFFGCYFCLFKSKKALCFIIPLIVGIAGVVGYLTIPVFQMGALWQVHLVVSALILLGSLIPMIECLFRAIDWCNPNHVE